MTDPVNYFELNTEDGHLVSCAQYSNGHPDVIVVAHGFMCSKDAKLIKRLAEELLDQYDVVTFDLRGHGKSSGLFTWTVKEHYDLGVVLKYARQHYQQVGLIGFSLGAAISLMAVRQYGLTDSLICVSLPAAFWKIDFHFWQLDIDTDIKCSLFGSGKKGKGVRPGPFWLKKSSD